MEPIYEYSREQAIKDGLLFDVSQYVKENDTYRFIASVGVFNHLSKEDIARLGHIIVGIPVSSTRPVKIVAKDRSIWLIKNKKEKVVTMFLPGEY